jgi:hypothetical protein
MLQTGLIITAVTITMLFLPGLAVAWRRLRGRYRAADAPGSGFPVPLGTRIRLDSSSSEDLPM